MKIGYYPGCTSQGTSREFEKSSRLVLEILGVELVEVPEWICCGASPGHQHSKLLSASLNVYNLARASELGLPVMTTCAMCYHRLAYVNDLRRSEPELYARAERAAEVTYDGGARVMHLLELLAELGPEKLREPLQKPLDGLKTACYYGCLLTRPPRFATAGGDAEEPRAMDEVLTAVGAEPVDWTHRTECCGASFTFSREDVVERLSGKVLEAARHAGADCVVVSCPMCQLNLDIHQRGASRVLELEERLKMPVVFLTELLGLAYGVKSKELELNRHFTSTRELVKRLG